MTRVRARRVMKLKLKPSSQITPIAGSSESGMARAAIEVARQSRRNRNTTRAARTMPSTRTCTVAS